MTKFDFTEILKGANELKRREAEERAKWNFLDDNDLNYRLKIERVDWDEEFPTSTRYYDTKRELYEHLSNIGYSDEYLLEVLPTLTIKDITILPTDDREISYHITFEKVDEKIILPKKLWRINTKELLKNKYNPNLEYYISEDKNVYRRSVLANNIIKINKEDSNKVIVGLTYGLKIDTLWDKWRGEEVNGSLL